MPYQIKKNISIKKYNRIKRLGERVAILRRNPSGTIECLQAYVYRSRAYTHEKLNVGEERLLSVWYSYDLYTLQFFKDAVILPISSTKYYN